MDRPSNVGASDLALTKLLRERRERLEISQTEVARALTEQGVKMSQSALSRVEKGERALTVGEAQALATVLSTSLEQLLQPSPVQETVAEARLAIRQSRLAYDELSRAARSYLDAMTALSRQAKIIDTEAARYDAKPGDELFALSAEIEDLLDELVTKRIVRMCIYLERQGNNDGTETSSAEEPNPFDWPGAS